MHIIQDFIMITISTYMSQRERERERARDLNGPGRRGGAETGEMVLDHSVSECKV